MALQILRDILQHFIDKIDAGTCSLTSEEAWEVVGKLIPFVREDDRLCRSEMEKEMNMNTRTFYRRMQEGKVSKGIKLKGKHRFWIRAQK